MLINDYAIHMPFRKAKVLRKLVLELLVIRDRPAQGERPGTQRAMDKTSWHLCL